MVARQLETILRSVAPVTKVPLCPNRFLEFVVAHRGVKMCIGGQIERSWIKHENVGPHSLPNYEIPENDGWLFLNSMTVPPS